MPDDLRPQDRPVVPHRHRQLASTLLVTVFLGLCLFGVIVAFSPRPATSPTSTPEPTPEEALRYPAPSLYKVDARVYSFSLETDCEMVFPPPRDDVPHLDFLLASSLRVDEVWLDGEPVAFSFVSRDARWSSYRIEAAITAAVEHRVRIVYHGLPDNYDPAQDRHWDRVTQEAAWLTNFDVWLPIIARYSSQYENTAFQLRVEVPGNWTVFCPAPQAAAVENIPPDVERSDQPPRRRAFTFASQPGDDNLACAFVAGPYEKTGEGETAGVSYEVWGLPDYLPQAEASAAEIEDILEFLEECLGPLLPFHECVVQLPPEQGGGVAWGQGLLCIAAWGAAFGDLGPEQVLVHEITHNVATFYDEGTPDFLSDYYLALRKPDTFQAALTTRRTYFFSTVAQYGGYSVKEAFRRRWAGNDVPEWHAYLYSQPALIWHMYRGYFGDEALVTALHQLQDDGADRDWSQATSLDDYLDFFARGFAAGAGPLGREFYERFATEDYHLDLAVEDAGCRRVTEKSAGSTTTDQSGDTGETWEVSISIRDMRENLDPPAREVLPWVEVGIVLAGGGEEGEEVEGEATGEAPATTMIVRRVPLTADLTKAKLLVSSRPLRVILDPNMWLLDYDSANNSTDLHPPLTPAQVLVVISPVLGFLLIWALAELVTRRIPKAVTGPPSAGRAK